jgi:uncharacterized DUF497 family protein
MPLITSAFASYTWDENKRAANLVKHKVDFEDAVLALEQPHLEMPSERNGEVRTLAICPETNRLIAVVFIARGDICRIISARVAHRNERREFDQSNRR